MLKCLLLLLTYELNCCVLFAPADKLQKEEKARKLREAESKPETESKPVTESKPETPNL